MRRPSLLFLAHRIPYPPNKGDKIRSFHLLNTLTRLGEVDLVTHADDPRDLAHVEKLRESCRSVTVFPLPRWTSRLRAARAVLSGEPLSVAWMTRGLARDFVHALLNERSYDAVVVYSSQGMSYLPTDCKIPVILDAVDVDSEKWAALSHGFQPSAWVAGIEARRMRRFERRAHLRSARVVLCTEREAALWSQRIGAEGVVAITNGVAQPAQLSCRNNRVSGRLVFCGAMDYEPNVRAAEIAATRVLPSLRVQRPDAHLEIVGRNPTLAVQRLSGLPGVSVTGEVPDVSAHLAAASIALIPLELARGIQNKVLEACAHGLPVVTTPVVAQSMHESAGEALVAVPVDNMATAVAELLANPERCEQLGVRARTFVAAHHSWSRFDSSYADLLKSVMVQTEKSSEEARACR
jgi:sugar transferase (PEP-CTERM/EpsH1 system associated)